MTTKEKTLRSAENPYTAATNTKPSPATFVIWLIATILLLGGAIGLAIPAGIQVSYYIDDKIFTDQLKQEIDNPCKEFDDLINACESGECDSLDDLEPYWVNLLESYESRGMSTSYFHWMYSSYEYKIYAVWSLAENAGFCTQETIDGKHVFAINSEHAGDFETALLSEIDSTYKDRLYWMYDSRNYALAFSIPSIVCLIVGIVGIFITIKQFKKLKEGRIAYENAVLAHAIAEEKQKSEMLLIMEAMQRKIDALEGKAPTEVTSQSTMQPSSQRTENLLHTASSPQQSKSAPTSVNAQKNTKQPASFMSSKRGLIEVLEDIQDDKEGFVKFLLVVAFAPVKLVIRTITLPSMCAALSKANKASKEIAAEYNARKAEGYENADHREAKEAYEKANTPQEKMEFFYGYFSSVETCKKPTLCAYIMTYLAENSSLFDKNDPLKLAPYFTVDVDKALYSLLGFNSQEISNGRHYEHLLRRVDGAPLSDKYVFQCLLIAVNGNDGDSVPLYNYDILGQESVSEEAE